MDIYDLYYYRYYHDSAICMGCYCDPCECPNDIMLFLKAAKKAADDDANCDPVD